MKKWLTVAEGAEYAGVSRDTIYTACERGELRHVRVGGRRAIRLRPEWVDEWLERNVVFVPVSNGPQKKRFSKRTPCTGSRRRRRSIPIKRHWTSWRSSWATDEMPGS